jgi:hypothetical protein
MWSRTLIRFDKTSAAVLLEHALYTSRNQYIKSVLAGGDANSYLAADLDPQWQNRLHYFEQEFASIAARAKEKNIRIVVVLVPSRGQAALVSRGHWDPQFDPYKLDNDMRQIVVRNGGIYLDILPSYRSIPYAENGFYPVDGHPDADGHSVIAKLLVQQLTGGAIPALNAEKTTMDKGN